MAKTAKETKVEIFVNRRMELHETDVTGATLLVEAGFEGEGWDLLQLQGEGDPTGGQLVQADQPLHLKNGERFRVILGNRTFGQD